jgi:putative drug exporter of the RND superfamily
MPTKRRRKFDRNDGGDEPNRVASFADWFAGIVVSKAAWIVAFWFIVAFGARSLAPSWNAVALDGDFAYLPADLPSVKGGRVLDDAMAQQRSRSQMVIVAAGSTDPASEAETLVGLDLLRRLTYRLGEVSLRRAIEEQDNSSPETWLELADESLTDAIEYDQEFYERLDDRVPETSPNAYEPRLAIAYWDRAEARRRLGRDMSEIGSDLESALILDPTLASTIVPVAERDIDSWMVLLDVYSWQDSVIGKQMIRGKTRLAVLSLSSELAATGNIELLRDVQQTIQDVRAYSNQYLNESERVETASMKLLVTGSAAIGGETLDAARAAIASTEWLTVVMILLILAIVYRAPLLVSVPLISIAVAVMVSTAIVTWLTQSSGHGWFKWLDLQVYTTSRIFVVVILFGAGTDYCLFLIARLREETSQSDWSTSCRNALSGVSGALMGSALTTILGLGMLWFADFGKFHHTGPIIAICLTIGLAVCMTLTPALLRLLGPKVFWPTSVATVEPMPRLKLFSDSGTGKVDYGGGWFWNAVAISLTRWPWTTMLVGWGLLLVPAVYGAIHEQSVTYDLSGQLSDDAMSRRGLAIVDESFGVGQFNPLSVLLVADQDLDAERLKERRESMVRRLYEVPGVRVVRHLGDPLGDFPPSREMGLLSSDGWQRRALQNHRTSRIHYTSMRPLYQSRLIRLDVIIDEDPFSKAASRRLSAIDERVAQTIEDWKEQGDGWSVAYAGTMPSIVDLRTVTLTDTRRIKLAVVGAVFLVLMVVLRRVLISVYLILTVLLSYFATLGLTYAFFQWLGGDTFLGLDWKLPIFLFVILVAVGQDYNVYLVTRIMEERQRLGSLAAIRRAVSRTGGIITACGLVMAATFFSMTASGWWPIGLPGQDGSSGQNSLQGIVQLGFALGLGVMIDTLYVRTVLVPSFIVLLDRMRRRQSELT